MDQAVYAPVAHEVPSLYFPSSSSPQPRSPPRKTLSHLKQSHNIFTDAPNQPKARDPQYNYPWFRPRNPIVQGDECLQVNSLPFVARMHQC